MIDGRTIKLIPLSGRYIPKIGDTIICKVIDVSFSGWRLDTNSAYSAMLSMKDATSEFIARGANLTQYYDVGEFLVCKIVNVTSQKLIDVTMKIMAAPVVIFAIAVAGPREPNMVWLDPPNPAPIDAPFPCCRRTITIRAKATIKWMAIRNAVSISKTKSPC